MTVSMSEVMALLGLLVNLGMVIGGVIKIVGPITEMRADLKNLKENFKDHLRDKH